MRKSIFIISLVVAMAACTSGNKQSGDACNPTTEQKSKTASSADDLLGKKWDLSELNGSPLTLDAMFPGKPYLVFEERNRIAGNLGCNGFGGNLEFKGNNEIKISEIVATKMACPNLKVEQAFLEALNTTKSFHVENNTLMLSNENQEVIAKLEVSAE
jgi:heat shock protein HslJ